MSNQPDQLWLMLGEIRSDLKSLVAERSATNRRLDKLEEEIEGLFKEHHDRINKLEGWKIRIGVLTGALGVLVPTSITIAAKKLGLI